MREKEKERGNSNGGVTITNGNASQQRKVQLYRAKKKRVANGCLYIAYPRYFHARSVTAINFHEIAS